MKSRDQERKEAIDRARAALPAHRVRWMSCIPDGRVYEEVKKHNPEYAELLHKEAQVSFEEAAARANTDLHGNPLS